MTVHENDSPRLKIYTTTWCGGCRTAKAVLDRAGVAYEAIDIDHDPAAVATVLAINGGLSAVPTIVFPDGRVLVEPNRRQLLAALGLGHPHRRG
jgi:mycoredoxin